MRNASVSVELLAIFSRGTASIPRRSAKLLMQRALDWELCSITRKTSGPSLSDFQRRIESSHEPGAERAQSSRAAHRSTDGNFEAPLQLLRQGPCALAHSLEGACFLFGREAGCNVSENSRTSFNRNRKAGSGSSEEPIYPLRSERKDRYTSLFFRVLGCNSLVDCRSKRGSRGWPGRLETLTGVANRGSSAAGSYTRKSGKGPPRTTHREGCAKNELCRETQIWTDKTSTQVSYSGKSRRTCITLDPTMIAHLRRRLRIRPKSPHLRKRSCDVIIIPVLQSLIGH